MASRSKRSTRPSPTGKPGDAGAKAVVVTEVFPRRSTAGTGCASAICSRRASLSSTSRSHSPTRPRCYRTSGRSVSGRMSTSPSMAAPLRTSAAYASCSGNSLPRARGGVLAPASEGGLPMKLGQISLRHGWMRIVGSVGFQCCVLAEPDLELPRAARGGSRESDGIVVVAPSRQGRIVR